MNTATLQIAGLLRLTNVPPEGAAALTFSDLARLVGQTKGPDNDQL